MANGHRKGPNRAIPRYFDRRASPAERSSALNVAMARHARSVAAAYWVMGFAVTFVLLRFEYDTRLDVAVAGSMLGGLFFSLFFLLWVRRNPWRSR